MPCSSSHWDVAAKFAEQTDSVIICRVQRSLVHGDRFVVKGTDETIAPVTVHHDGVDEELGEPHADTVDWDHVLPSARARAQDGKSLESEEGRGAVDLMAAIMDGVADGAVDEEMLDLIGKDGEGSSDTDSHGHDDGHRSDDEVAPAVVEPEPHAHEGPVVPADALHRLAGVVQLSELYEKVPGLCIDCRWDIRYQSSADSAPPTFLSGMVPISGEYIKTTCQLHKDYRDSRGRRCALHIDFRGITNGLERAKVQIARWSLHGLVCDGDGHTEAARLCERQWRDARTASI